MKIQQITIWMTTNIKDGRRTAVSGYKDDYTTFKFGFVLKMKYDFKNTLEAVNLNVRILGNMIKTIVKIRSSRLSKKLNSKKLTAPYTPQQNGSVKPENRIIIKIQV